MNKSFTKIKNNKIYSLFLFYPDFAFGRQINEFNEEYKIFKIGGQTLLAFSFSRGYIYGAAQILGLDWAQVIRMDINYAIHGK